MLSTIAHIPYMYRYILLLIISLLLVFIASIPDPFLSIRTASSHAYAVRSHIPAHTTKKKEHFQSTPTPPLKATPTPTRPPLSPTTIPITAVPTVVPTTAPASISSVAVSIPPTPISQSQPVPASHPQPAPTQKPAAPPPLSCPSVIITGNQAPIMGDSGVSGSGTTIGYITTQLSVQQTSGKGTCVPTNIQQVSYIQLLGNYPETNGPTCVSAPHLCGVGGTIHESNTQTGTTDGTWSTQTIYGIWAGPFGPKGIYGADAPNPLAVTSGNHVECAIAEGYYQDNYGKFNYTRIVQNGDPQYCWTNNP